MGWASLCVCGCVCVCAFWMTGVLTCLVQRVDPATPYTSWALHDAPPTTLIEAAWCSCCRGVPVEFKTRRRACVKDSSVSLGGLGEWLA